MKQLDFPQGHACTGYRERLSARRDGEGHGDDAELTRHLTACPECVAFERGLDALAPLFDPLRHAAPPPALFEGIAERLPRAERLAVPVAAPTMTSSWFLRAAAGLVGFLSVFGLARWRGDEAPGPASSSFELFARVERALDHPAELGSVPEREFLAHYSSPAEAKR